MTTLPPVRALEWRGGLADGVLVVLDQTLLPGREVFLERRSSGEVIDDVRRLAVRGAPLIGLAGAYAVVLAAREALAGEGGEPFRPSRFFERLAARAEEIASARPTAANLRRAVRSVTRAAWTAKGGPVGVANALLRAARDLEDREVAASHAIARHGAAWLGDRRRILTHCNAGALAAPGLGTALAPVYLLHGRAPVHVWVDETRPLLQGLRLTAWELARAGVPHTVLVEGAAAGLLRSGAVDAVIVGADRVCRNGDVVNKVGTYSIALAAREHGVPFLVAAPLTTLDPAAPSGDRVPIEDRPGDSTLYLTPGTAAASPAYAPAFDVTPARLVTALVTERGVLETPDEGRISGWMAEIGPVEAGGNPGR